MNKILGAKWIELGWIDFSLLRPTHPSEEIVIQVIKSSKSPQNQVIARVSKSNGKICLEGTFQ